MKFSKIHLIFIAVIITSILAGTLGSRTSQAYSLTINEFLIGSPSAIPGQLSSGPDGNLWFTEYDRNRIARMTPAGVITTYSLPTTDSAPFGITAGPDGNLWFTESNANKIGRITPEGVITEFSLGTGLDPWEITLGPEGNLWFTEWDGNLIGRITPVGVVTKFSLPHPDSDPDHIIAGPDGNLWFTERGGNRIGRITPEGELTEFVIPTPDSTPEGLVFGIDGNLWFTEHTGNKIARMTLLGQFTEFPLPVPGSGPGGIVLGTDGYLWFSEHLRHRLGRITQDGIITEYLVPTTNSWPDHLVLGPDRNIWFTEENGSRIGQVAFVSDFSDVPVRYWAWGWIERLYLSEVTSGCNVGPLMYCPEDTVTRAQMAIFLERAKNGPVYLPPPATGQVFADVSTATFASAWIENLYSDGITGGCQLSPLSFCPGSPVTRDQMAVFLLRAEHGLGYAPPPAVGLFWDVPADHWAAAWIEQLYTERITGGCILNPLSYCPDSSVTRSEMAVFLVRTFHLP